MYVIAVPTKTMLMVMIIGVTLFLEMAEIKRHSNETVSYTHLTLPTTEAG